MSSAQFDLRPQDDLFEDLEAPPSPTALKQQVAERLAAHRSRRKGNSASTAPTTMVRSADTRADRISATVALRLLRPAQQSWPRLSRCRGRSCNPPGGSRRRGRRPYSQGRRRRPIQPARGVGRAHFKPRWRTNPRLPHSRLVRTRLSRSGFSNAVLHQLTRASLLPLRQPPHRHPREAGATGLTIRLYEDIGLLSTQLITAPHPLQPADSFDDTEAEAQGSWMKRLPSARILSLSPPVPPSIFLQTCSSSRANSLPPGEHVPVLPKVRSARSTTKSPNPLNFASSKSSRTNSLPSRRPRPSHRSGPPFCWMHSRH